MSVHLQHKYNTSKWSTYNRFVSSLGKKRVKAGWDQLKVNGVCLVWVSSHLQKKKITVSICSENFSEEDFRISSTWMYLENLDKFGNLSAPTDLCLLNSTQPWWAWVPVKVCRFVNQLPINILVKSEKIIHLSLLSSMWPQCDVPKGCFEVHVYFV